MTEPYENPAERLAGMNLKDGWVVGEKLPTGRRGGGTGGFFSVSYSVTNGKQQAFLKAFDIFKPIAKAVEHGQPFTTALLAQLQAYEFEAQLHTICANSNMRRIVKILTHGQVDVALVHGEQFGTVPYMIMELADGGDVRSYIHNSPDFDTSLQLHYLRDVVSGINQLHKAQIAHQDLKPSNVMIFSETGAKIGDLGRASKQNSHGLFDTLNIAGDKAYAPPEQIYKLPLENWLDKRQRCDLYQFGSLISFLFFGVTFNTILMDRLPPELVPIEWGGKSSSYDQALPFLLELFNETLTQWKESLPDWLADDLIAIINQCGNPDYRVRGIQKKPDTLQNSLGLDRLVSKLDNLGFKATIEARKNSARKTKQGLNV